MVNSYLLIHGCMQYIMFSQLTLKQITASNIFAQVHVLVQTHMKQKEVSISLNSRDTSDRRCIRCLTPHMYGYIQPLPFSQIIISVSVVFGSIS